MKEMASEVINQTHLTSERVFIFLPPFMMSCQESFRDVAAVL